MTTAKDPFGAVRKPKNRRKGKCRLCFESLEDSGARVVVAIQERRPRPGWEPGRSNPQMFVAVDQNSVTLCANCAVGVYEQVVEVLRDKVGPAGGIG